MSEKRRFLRKCAGCGEYKEKKELIKITTENKTGEVFINEDNKLFGRSCYICRRHDCVDKAFHKHKIAKFLKKNIDSSFKEKIIAVLDE